MYIYIHSDSGGRPAISIYLSLDVVVVRLQNKTFEHARTPARSIAPNAELQRARSLQTTLHRTIYDDMYTTCHQHHATCQAAWAPYIVVMRLRVLCVWWEGCDFSTTFAPPPFPWRTIAFEWTTRDVYTKTRVDCNGILYMCILNILTWCTTTSSSTLYLRLMLKTIKVSINQSKYMLCIWWIILSEPQMATVDLPPAQIQRRLVKKCVLIVALETVSTHTQTEISKHL